MTKKELKDLASKIAKYQYVVESANDDKMRKAAEMEIQRLTDDNFSEIFPKYVDQFDDLVQEYLEKYKKKN